MICRFCRTSGKLEEGVVGDYERPCPRCGGAKASTARWCVACSEAKEECQACGKMMRTSRG